MKDDERRIVEDCARGAGIEPAALVALVMVESGGRTLAPVGGRLEPLIRFEGHYFDRLLSSTDRSRARTAGLAHPSAGAVRNPASQAERWRLLEQAAAIDRAAAYASTSWGVGQIMGDHWRRLGYASVEALVAQARSGLGGQLKLMIRFIEKAGLVNVLNRHDWSAFARAYNGPAFARNSYDRKLAEAHALASRRTPLPEPLANQPVLRLGSRGQPVMRLQEALNGRGAALAVDGIFGPLTERAVRHLQAGNGLAADGVVGPRTQAALGRRRSILAIVYDWLRALNPLGRRA
jgi:hypothetical protein